MVERDRREAGRGTRCRREALTGCQLNTNPAACPRPLILKGGHFYLA